MTSALAPAKYRRMRKIFTIIGSISLLAGALFPLPSTRAADENSRSIPGRRVVTIASDEVHKSFIPAPRRFRDRGFQQSPTAHIVVNYIGSWPQDAMNAFAYAADIWESAISSSEEIRIDAQYTYIGDHILGQSRPYGYWIVSGKRPDTFYAVALADALEGYDHDPTWPDIYVSMGNQWSWNFDPTREPSSSQYDFISVALQEIAHGLGFTDSFAYTGGIGAWGYTSNSGALYPSIYDVFVISGSNQQLINTSIFPNSSTTLGSQLVSNNIYFNGANATSGNGGLWPRLYAPTTWNSGSSIAHLDELTYPAGNAHSLMTPQISLGEAIHDPGSITRGIFQDTGWTIVDPNAPADSCGTSTKVDWFLWESCTIYGTIVVHPEDTVNVVVGGAATVTIDSSANLSMDLTRQRLYVQKGGQLLIKKGGKID